MSVSVSAKGDFAYVFYAFNPFGLDYYKLIIAPANDLKEMVITSSEQSDEMAYVAFSSNNQDLVVYLVIGVFTAPQIFETSLFSV